MIAGSVPKLPPQSRIVITGVGLTAPNGNDLASYREGLLAGRSGVSPYEVRYFGKTLAGVPHRLVRRVNPHGPGARTSTGILPRLVPGDFEVADALDLPILADCQFAALVCGAHPYKIVQSHWQQSRATNSQTQAKPAQV